MEPSLVISVFTLNIWGLPSWISKDKSERIKAIGQSLRSKDYDVICLQEVWSENDFKLINSILKVIYKYSHYFYSGVVGSGLCLFSKWPIHDTMYHQWPLNGYIHMIHHGDWFGGKGVGLAVLLIKGYKVNIYTTHLHAQYDLVNDSYLAHRVEQAFDTALFVRLTSGDSHLSVLAGDLNSEPGSLCERLVRLTAKLRDTYSASTEEMSIGTNECSRNSYSSEAAVALPSGLRIDYILYKTRSDIEAQVLSYSFPLEERVPGKKFSYSDHEAVAATIKISPSAEGTIPYDRAMFEKTLREGIHICSSFLNQLNISSWFYWTLAITLFCGVLVTPLFIQFPLLHSTFYYVTLILSVILMVCFILMATLWCKLEFNGILGVKNRMELLLERLNDNT